MGKGSRPRITDKKKYDKNYEQIKWDRWDIEEEHNIKDYYFERHIK